MSRQFSKSEYRQSILPDRPAKFGGYLMLTRREGEIVVIGDPANPIGYVRVMQTLSDRTRLAFDFPKHIEIMREEVVEVKRAV